MKGERIRMRLIDVDALKKDLKAVTMSNGTIVNTYTIIALLDKYPTAYDINKAVKELKTDLSVKLFGSKNSGNYMIPVEKAIEIVKQGVVSDDVCEWKYNDTEYYWESSCEHIHIFLSDGPKENEYDFCPYCSKKIKVVE